MLTVRMSSWPGLLRLSVKVGVGGGGAAAVGETRGQEAEEGGAGLAGVGQHQEGGQQAAEQPFPGPQGSRDNVEHHAPAFLGEVGQTPADTQPTAARPPAECLDIPSWLFSTGERVTRLARRPTPRRRSSV